ncbi:SDR family NAD(P)-dependent oxidoreductase, partial [Polaromonas sp.]|uniref:SDR family NAD(P)-dependent oxidoreductase n=1 Tax=Polaromonas sp. TaxID=1869339 RepID=UPI00352A59CF
EGRIIEQLRGTSNRGRFSFSSAGASVGVLDQNGTLADAVALAIRRTGALAASAVADVEDHFKCRSATEKIEAEIGPIDILINNAAISPKHNGRSHSVLDMATAEWEKVLAVNLGGTVNMIKQVAPGMMVRGWGRIINMSSVGSLFYAGLAGAHYSASKAAINSLTRTLAGEFGSCGITVNAIVPGRVATPMATGADSATNMSILRSIPLGRFADAREIASLVLFVASEEAAYMTGETIPITGGMSLGSQTKSQSMTLLSGI